MSDRRVEVAIGGFLVLLFLSLIGWNIALYYNFRIQPVVALLIATFGLYILGIILRTDK